MADKKISQLTGAATPLAGTEVLPVVQSGSTVKVSVADLTAGRTVAVSGLTTTGNLAVGTVGSKLTFDTLGSAGSTYLQTTNDYDLTIFNGRGGNPNIVLHNTDGIQFKSGSTLDMSVKSGNLVIGTAAKGIDFSANTGAAGETSALLDWYEEGTWTPSLGGDTVYAGQTGRYTRIGRCRVVYWTMRVQSTTSTSSTAGTTVFTGFPFVASSATYVFTAINNATLGTLGNGAITVSGGNTTAYAPTWSALADVALTGFYTV